MKNVTANQAAQILIQLRKREIDNSKYYVLQSAFDDYVDAFIKNGEYEQETDEVLEDAAFNAVTYDGFMVNFQ